MTSQTTASALIPSPIADFAAYEEGVYQKHQIAAEKEIIAELQATLENPALLAELKFQAGRLAMKCLGMRPITIRLTSGQRYSVNSPLFIKTAPKDKRRSKNRSNVTCHLALLYLGIHRQCSPGLISKSLTAAALCPSFDIACDALNQLGTTMNHSLLQRLTYHAADELMCERAANVVDDAYKADGLRIAIQIDGGRLRKRINKKKGSRRFTGEWCEPKLFTIFLLDAEGNKRKDIAPIYDGAVTGPDQIFQLLTEYLGQINYQKAEAVTFCADGAHWIWPRLLQLINDLDIPNAHRILDYTHAKQNLMDLVDTIHEAIGVWDYERAALAAKLKNYLWEGRIDKIRDHINTVLWRKRAKKPALKKLDDYFGDHAKFQYASLKAQNLPTGSGGIESAIRRIINLRIKGPGLFWKQANADRMIFLRSQILSGRWEQVFKNACQSWRNQLKAGKLQLKDKAA